MNPVQQAIDTLTSLRNLYQGYADSLGVALDSLQGNTALIEKAVADRTAELQSSVDALTEENASLTAQLAPVEPPVETPPVETPPVDTIPVEDVM